MTTGGVAAVLALQSLFQLIMNYNLDYPDFFAKLYRLLQPTVFHTKYRYVPWSDGCGATAHNVEADTDALP